MITKDQFHLMAYIKSHPNARFYDAVQNCGGSESLTAYSHALVYLIKIEYVLPPDAQRNNSILSLSQSGIQALEEYKAFCRSETRNNKTLKAAKCANRIAVAALIASLLAWGSQLLEWFGLIP